MQGFPEQHRRGGFGPARRIEHRLLLVDWCRQQCSLPGREGVFDGQLWGEAQVEGLLVGFEPGAGAFEEHAEFDVGVGGSDVFDDFLPAVGVAGNLHGGGPGFGADSPDERHSMSVDGLG